MPSAILAANNIGPLAAIKYPRATQTISLVLESNLSIMSGMAIGVKLESKLAITEDSTSDVMIRKMRLFDNCIFYCLTCYESIDLDVRDTKQRFPFFCNKDIHQTRLFAFLLFLHLKLHCNKGLIYSIAKYTSKIFCRHPWLF